MPGLNQAAGHSTLTPRQAVWRGHSRVSAPALAIMGACGFIGWFVIDKPAGVLLGMVFGVAPAWLWWSWAIPRWRDWLNDEGISEASVYREAVNTGLVFPKGFFFEGTEFRRRDGTKGWRAGSPPAQ
jgi:hypothetical protein